MLRLCAVFLFAAFLPFWAPAQQTNAIVLIDRDAVSRAIKPENYNHSLWIRWALATDPAGSNFHRLLAPMTGYDWRLPSDTSPTPELLKSIGALDARHDWVGVLSTEVLQQSNSSLDLNAALLGFDRNGTDQTITSLQGAPPGSLVVASARSWDDVAAVSHKISGNTLVISYPPPPGSTVSAAWLLGRKEVPVPRSTRIPGLVPATEVVTLATQPDKYDWRPAGDLTAEQWMRTIVSTRPTQLISLFCFVLIIALWTLRSLAIESGGRMARFAISMLPCAFVALYLAGNFAKATGLAPWNILPFFAYFALLLGLLPVYLAMRALWPRAHPLFPLVLMMATMLMWAEPLYTVFSNVFTLVPLPVSPIAVGGLIAALTATSAFAFTGGLWPRILAAILLCTTMLLSVLGHAWWAPEQFLLMVPLIAVVCGAGVMRLYLLPILVAWPFIYHPWNGRLAWDINWLLNNYADRGAINTAAQMQFLVSPAWLITLVAFAVTALFGGDFLKHQLRRSFAASNNARALFWAALATACLGIREPYMLDAALVVLISGFLTLLFDAAGTL